ncbi:efflux RND transporter permease subunit [Lentisphaerota bacterium WC36G]|nr:efflux RND transporter permease subunit [Lentisphaerae bacterium WC36]
MNLAEFSIKKKVITIVCTVFGLIAGILFYQKLPRLEDPEFTIKDALIITQYPGASAQEVENEVTEVIEKACQQLGQLKELSSISMRGQSIVTASIKDKYDKNSLPQVWDELRRKVNDAQALLPPGASRSYVNDDYGDVFGIYYAITGDGYSMAELKEIAKALQKELLLVQDVKKIELYGVLSEAIYVKIYREKLAALGINVQEIFNLLAQKNIIADAGRVKVGSEYIAITPTGAVTTVEELGELLISNNTSQLIRLKDIAKIERSYIDPATNKLLFNGKNSVGMAISTVLGGNVSVMGDALKKRLKELAPIIPTGVKLNIISMQSDSVEKAVSGFVVNLIEAIAIVIIVLLIFMGLKSGLLIGFVLLLTISFSFIIMGVYSITLERISLGALIIALGMLVDNAIVVTEGMMVKIKAGADKMTTAKEVVGQQSLPLLGATIIAILAFAAIGLSQDSTGEFCRSLFYVLLISLSMSWITAVTVTPLLCYYAFDDDKNIKLPVITRVLGLFIPNKKRQSYYENKLKKIALKIEKQQQKTQGMAPYSTGFFKYYRKYLALAIKWRYLTLLTMVILLFFSIQGFSKIENNFFPNSTRPQFMIDIWFSEGTHINSTTQQAKEIAKEVKKYPQVTDITSFVGAGGKRFILTYAPEKPNTAYAQLLVSVNDWREIDSLMLKLQKELSSKFSNANILVKKFILGPGDGGKIQARFSGPNYDILRDLAEQTMAVMRADDQAVGIRSDWRQLVKIIKPVMSDMQARRVGITYHDVCKAIKEAFQGIEIGIFRDNDEIIKIYARSNNSFNSNVKNISNIDIWSPIAQKYIPLRQVVEKFETVWENPIIWRRDRVPTITIHCDRSDGVPSILWERLAPKIAAINLPEGYKLEWGGEKENSADAQVGLAAKIPVFIIMMILIVIFLFNSIKKPLIIWLTVPLAIIGVTVGLLVFNQPFGFMSLLGFLSLSGMLIKNAIVLIDEITIQLTNGIEPYRAIMDSSASRVRPVSMAAATTVLGMIPLLTDAFFVSMAVTIMFGLTFACILTLLVVPVMYATFYGIKKIA